ncbi:MAG: phosphate acyltransferase PlsX [Oscillospiraceae bacterium]|nr:phosphate acyltransferase PlsX [Oscillospiraceae bacterium]
MNIILDAHGGDHAPLEAIKGAELAVKEYGVSVTLCGVEEEIRALADEHKVNLDEMRIVPAAQVLPMAADPSEIFGQYSESSMAVSMRLLADGGGDALVTAGNTGAMAMGASIIVKRLPGIKRAALAVIVPNARGSYLLLDVGANVECRPEMLQQFGIMGSAYMEKVVNIQNPRVGMINIGTEETKGHPLQIEAGVLLRESAVNFIGNIEARELPFGGCDVAVCDGFTGNVTLKLTEGMGKWISAEFKRILLKKTSTKLAAILIRDGLTKFKQAMDYTEYGGAPLLGLRSPVIKAHGSSNAHAFKNAVRQAKTMVETEMIGQISQSLRDLNGHSQ